METEKIDRVIENQVMIVNLLGAIFYNQTGKVPVVHVDTKNGTLKMHPVMDSVKYSDEAELYSFGNPKANRIGVSL